MSRIATLLTLLAIVLLSPLPAWAQWTTPAVTAPRLQYRTFQSAAAGTTVSYHIYTPPAYDANPQQRFPVIYWLHGAGSPTAGIAPMTNWFASAMARGDLAPALVVFPNGMPYGMYSNAANGTRPLETVLIQELIPTVDATFRTIALPKGRILEGFSMGGYGAGRLGFTYTNLFGAISMLGAGPVQTDFMNAPVGTSFPPDLRPTIFQDVWNSDPAIFYAQSPWNLAQVNAPAILAARPLLRLAVGEADAMFAPNADLRAHLQALGIPHDWRTYPGIDHAALPLLQAMGPENWTFYRRALAPDCDTVDFNRDGVFPDDQDLSDFLTVLSGAPCPACSDVDFNNDGIFPDDQDLAAFLRVLAGGTC